MKGLLLFALAAAVAASSAAAVGATATKTVDATYSCRVQAKQSEHFIDLDLAVTYPPLNGYHRPARMSVKTWPKTFQSGGTSFLISQVYFEHVKNSLKVDQTNCRKARHAPALTHAGLGVGTTVTPNKLGQFEERCITKKRVLIRYRITMSNGTPESALVAIRNDDTKSKPVAFFRWAPRKITGYLGSCVYNPPHLGA